MKTNRLAILLPCDAIESLALDRPSAEAQELLTGWTAMWHPVLLLATREIPGWQPAAHPPSNHAGHLFILPECSRPLLPAGWLEGGEGEPPQVVMAGDDRQQLMTALLEAAGPAEESCDPELVPDFLAAGFCYLLVELLTRQLRYMSNLDESSFRSALIAAAEEAAKGNAAEARRRLQSGSDLLGDAREYFYPVESRMLDLTLVAPTTLGPSLQKALSEQDPVNLLIAGGLIDRLAREHSETLSLLKERMEKKRVGLIGGEYEERPLPLLPPEAIRFHLERGLAAYERHLGQRPTVFGRRLFGLTPMLPPILRRLGFKAALHFTLDDGRFPIANQSRVQWQGVDGRSFEALSRLPLDAGQPESFLRLAERLGDIMDLDHSATTVFAHWPAAASEWYADLRRAARSARALGSFATIEEYIEQTPMSGQSANYPPDRYHAPYLRQSVSAGEQDPISRWVVYFRNRAAVDAIRALETFAACASGRIDVDAQADLDRLVAEVEQAGDATGTGLVTPFTEPGGGCPATGTAGPSAEPSDLMTALTRAARKVAEALGFRVGDGVTGSGATAVEDANPATSSALVLNTHAAQRRVCLRWPEPIPVPDVAGMVRAAGGSGDHRVAVADVPAMGFVGIEPGTGGGQVESEPEEKTGWLRRKPKPKVEPPMAEELDDRLVLRNERCQVVFDKYTGAIRGISDYRTRGARMAQQIALRLPDPSEPDPADDAHYTISAADSWHIGAAGPLVGEIYCRGRLMSRQGLRMAGFRQTTRLWRGGRVVEIEIELEPDSEPGDDPWSSYYAARFAWNDATANLYRSVSQLNLPTDANLLEAPHFVDVRTSEGRTTLLCNGLPYHRRFGLRRLDTLLVVRGETARTFRLGIGLDLPHPVHAALDGLLPPVVLPVAGPAPSPGGWLFHLDHRNVLITHWEPLSERLKESVSDAVSEREGCYDPTFDDYWDPEAAPPDVPPSEPAAAAPESEPTVIDPSQLAGLRLRLIETDGRRTQVGLRVLRPVIRAEKLGEGNRSPTRLEIADDRVTIPLGTHEWAEVELWFS